MNKYPNLKSTYCGADAYNSFTIGADGFLYKCWKDVGNKEKCVGHILRDINLNENISFSYLLYDATTSIKCKMCKLMPLCMGGCPYKRIIDGSDNCSIYKYQLDHFMRTITNRLKNSNA